MWRLKSLKDQLKGPETSGDGAETGSNDETRPEVVVLKYMHLLLPNTVLVSLHRFEAV